MSKEWKGNSASWKSMLGINKRCTNDTREAGDYYTTAAAAAVEQFIQHYHSKFRLFGGGFNFKIWEPACGCGNISEVLIDHGYSVISTDMYDRGYGESGVDFLATTKMPANCDTIITNPPYSLSNEFILHAMDILPLYGRYFALLNISYLTGNIRFRDIYSKGYLKAIHIYPHRINCYKNNIDTGKSSPVNYAWFEFRKLPIEDLLKIYPPEIYWIEK